MMDFFFQEHLFSATPLNVQKQLFKVVLLKINLRNFTAKYAPNGRVYRTHYFHKFASYKPATWLKKDSDDDMPQ